MGIGLVSREDGGVSRTTVCRVEQNVDSVGDRF